ncbi:FMN-linked oxidoreductase [Trametes coccinea BRFM310]|uniref:FMN-linked oxidoreductase n=1 Tax=Trametes coccinea (strain BRFM310) TaxID=1353009 RepID=A0A1Y2IV42_TRAC3|nr:FMN-linked oxidoreductase [Trametes coccinea BRFM310]
MAYNTNFEFNRPAPNTSYFTPAQYPPAGTAMDPQPNGKPIPTLFKPLKIRGVEFQNRIWLSPLCQYSSENGVVQEWQHAHLGGIFTRGPGLTLVEATAVLPEGRITPECAGIWNDEQAAAWAKIVEFAHSQGQKIGIQLAHAGRKASTLAPFVNMGRVADEAAGGWPDDVWGPSEVPFNEQFPKPKALTRDGIKRIVKGFVDAAKRAVRAGFDVIEIHGAHGYLISSFLSPTSNKRTDEYGGSFENRIRLAVEVVDAVRAVIPPTMPLFFRVSASEWLEEVFPDQPSWRSEDTVRLAGVLAEHGVDLLDVSSSGNNPAQKIKTGPAYQAHFAEAVKRAHGDKILVSAVGSINDGQLAQSVLDKGQADVIFVGRMFQKNPGLVWKFADDLGVEIHVAGQIAWGFRGRAKAVANK